MRGLVRLARLNVPERCQEFLGRSGRNGTTSYIRVQKALEPGTQDLHGLRPNDLLCSSGHSRAIASKVSACKAFFGLAVRISRDADRLDSQGFPDFLRRH
jgi:hypothetical protein